MRKLKLSNNSIILGIDEVGRGPWAGPLVIGAVILNCDIQRDELTDSKKLTARKRSELSPQILQNAAATGLGWVSAAEIDQYGLSNSLKLATRRAIKQILVQKAPFDEIIIDGTVNFLRDTPLADHVTVLKKADLLIKEVSAASIIAKVARDQYMIDLAQKYPHYGFEKHVGYGTALHKQTLAKYGPCAEHRKSFRPIRELLESNFEYQPLPEIERQDQPIIQLENIDIAPVSQSSTRRGQHAEQVIINHLEALGHTIIAHNYKTQTYEIDIISLLDENIYFTEVKYRKSSNHGNPVYQVTTTKYQQITYATQSFIASHPEFSKYQPLLAVGTVAGPDFHFEDWFTLKP